MYTCCVYLILIKDYMVNMNQKVYNTKIVHGSNDIQIFLENEKAYVILLASIV